jgi:hypothetical protein
MQIDEKLLPLVGKVYLERDLAQQALAESQARLDAAVLLLGQVALGTVRPGQLEVNPPERTWTVLPAPETPAPPPPAEVPTPQGN